MYQECPDDPILQEDLEIIAQDCELSEALRGKNVLITGATGLVGSQLMRSLACMNRISETGNGMTLYGLIRNRGKAETIYGRAFMERPDVHFICADITNPDFAEKVRNEIAKCSDTAAVHPAASKTARSKEEAAGVHLAVSGTGEVSRQPLSGSPLPLLDLVFHGAAVTTSKTMVEKPVETIMTAITGTKNVLDLAKVCGAQEFIYLSSMEMYGNLVAGTGQRWRETAVGTDPAFGKKAGKGGSICSRNSGGRDSVGSEEAAAITDQVCREDTAREGFLVFGEEYSQECNRGNQGNTLATEDRLGWLDLGAVRTDYPESKRMCENLCIGYGKEYGLHVRIARLAQTFGAGILPWEGRVFAQFAHSVMEGKNIVLHTRGLSEGNYCYTRDAVRGILTIAARGADGEAYNVANESTHTTIAAMAQMVAEKIANGRISVVYDLPEDSSAFGYAADTKLRLDSSKLRALGWEPEVGLEEMYRRMIASMRTQ